MFEYVRLHRRILHGTFSSQPVRQSVYDACHLQYGTWADCHYFLLFPPVQLGFGATALILAYASRLNRPLTIPAVIGAVLGILSIIVSVIMCATVLYGIRMMDDPANAAFMREFMKEYQDALNSLYAR